MRMNRLYVDLPIQAGRELYLPEDRSHYLSRVLRARPGDGVTLFNGDGQDYPANLVAMKGKQALLSVAEAIPGVVSNGPELVLAQAISRGDRMDWCLQKATELGVARIDLVDSERVQVKLKGERLQRRLEHWQGVVVSACEQSGRATLPELRAPLSLAEWLAAAPGQAALLDPEGERSLVDWCGDCDRDRSITLLVGPEGGFSEVEINQARTAGLAGLRLGPRILRTETAGPAALAVIQALLGDLS